jgi:hypothetical protein
MIQLIFSSSSSATLCSSMSHTSAVHQPARSGLFKDLLFYIHIPRNNKAEASRTRQLLIVRTAISVDQSNILKSRTTVLRKRRVTGQLPSFLCFFLSQESTSSILRLGSTLMPTNRYTQASHLAKSFSCWQSEQAICQTVVVDPENMWFKRNGYKTVLKGEHVTSIGVDGRSGTCGVYHRLARY